MHKLTIYNETAEVLNFADENQDISRILNQVGVRFEQWNAKFSIQPEHSEENIKDAYRESIDRLIRENGYQTCDIINVTPDIPNREALRAKFLSEHTHSEDEVRFFIKGHGLFSLHVGDKVYSVRCHQGDLISVPANVPHWFDMGEAPSFSCIRLFNNPEGWVAQYTGNKIAKIFGT